MKPDDIPQDVWVAADAAFEIGSVFGSMARVTISRAILEERERCAKVVSEFPETVALSEEDMSRYGALVREASRADIAAAIRKGD